MSLIPAAGLFYVNSLSAWDISSALTEKATLIDEVKDVGSVTGLWYTAIGVDLGSSQDVSKLIFYDWDTSGTGLWGATFHTTNIYKSDDGITWTFVEQFDSVSRSGGGSNEIGVIEISLTNLTTARYFCRYYSDPLMTSDYTIIGGSEVEAFGIETFNFNSDSHIWGTETEIFDSDSNVYIPETGTFNSDSHIRGIETFNFNLDSHIRGIETGMFNSDSHIWGTETEIIASDARVIARGSIESEYKVPRRIQPDMRNIDTTPQTGGQDDGGFRIF